MINPLKWILARFHLSDWAVCEMSMGKGLYDDYHDYKDSLKYSTIIHDSIDGYPEHFTVLTCKRCGKAFVRI